VAAVYVDLLSKAIQTMSHQEHGHQHSHPHDHQHGHQHGHKRKGLHKDWRAWLVVGLMLAAMAAYVLSMDESIRPGGAPGQAMPADAPAP
jgi:ABC-type nickel/cobalt efflux system permease component RcnA